MINLTRILCPADFSEFALQALTHAAALARWYDARLTLLHVYRIGIPLSAMAPGMGPVGAEAVMLSVADQQRFIEDLQRLAAAAGATDVAPDLKVLEGDVVQAICEEAQDGRADLIVLGTHGRSGFERLVLGSVTEKLLRKAPCSLLTVPAASVTPPAPQLFASIVVATDFSDIAGRAVAHALSLAQEANARVTVMHVVEMSESATNLGEIVGAARARLADAVPSAARDWCQVRERVETGRAHREIVRVAEEEHAGLIVIGAHGHGAVERFFFGSTAHHVVRAARCPVLAVRL